MRVLVVSDSHGYIGKFLQVLEEINPDVLIHLGDGFKDCDKIRVQFPQLEVHQVCGNCDVCMDGTNEQLLELGGVRMFLCHGHTRGVKESLLNACYAAESKEAQLLLFGHTHHPLHQKAGELTILNPGSIGYDGRYALLDIEKGFLRCNLHCI